MRTRSAGKGAMSQEMSDIQSEMVMEDVSDAEIEQTNDEESEKPIYTMEDVERAKKLLQSGRRDLICNNHSDASNSLSEAASILGGYYGETSLESAEAFYFYGRALLELARKEPAVVANAIQGLRLEQNDDEAAEPEKTADGARKVEEEDGEKEEEEPIEDIREKVLDALDENSDDLEKKRNGSTTHGATTIPTETKEEEENPIDEQGGEKDVETAKDNGGDEKTDETGATEEAGDENKDGESDVDPVDDGKELPEEITNLQLSWEMLDLARSIYEKQTDKESRKRLADCRLFLGEQAIEDDEFEKAIDELNSCLTLQKEILDPDDRSIALCYYNMGLAYNFNEKFDQAAEAFQQALAVLTCRQANFEARLNSPTQLDQNTKDIEFELNDLKACIEDLKTRIQDSTESGMNFEESKAAMKKDEDGEKTNGVVSAAAADTTSDITHLVRKSTKRADQTEAGGDTAKKQKLDEEPTQRETNGGDHAAMDEELKSAEVTASE